MGGRGVSMIHPEHQALAGKTRWVMWVLGGIGTLIFGALVAWFVTASVNESAKIDKMVSIADGIAAADWRVTRVSDPRRDIGCIPFDQPCYSLFRDWEAPGPVDLDELAAPQAMT